MLPGPSRLKCVFHSFGKYYSFVNKESAIFSGFHIVTCQTFNTLRPRQNGRRFADDTFERIFLNENVWISIKISLNFVPRGPINNISALVQIMAWRRPGDMPLSEPTMESLPTHICVTRPQWVNNWSKMIRHEYRNVSEYVGSSNELRYGYHIRHICIKKLQR